MPTIITRNPNEISLANFTVLSGANRLERHGASVAMGGAVENGAVKFGKVCNLSPRFYFVSFSPWTNDCGIMHTFQNRC
jgi:hypothetical protein